MFSAPTMVFDRQRALDRGHEVLRLEAAALGELRQRLGPPFLDACQAILDCEGRVVVTGMGKAGLIGQKISATLASTGTPSLPVHPAEALHGDLGRILREDLVLALSKSGKTRELLALMPHLKALGAKVLVVTENADCPLAGYADLVLETGSLGEACPLGLAPTVTTTVMLALGDALAMTVLEGRSFTREEFAAFHPGGDLGRSFLKVAEIMRKGKELPLLAAGAGVRDALAVMTETPGRPGAALVVDADGCLQGIFTDGDLRRTVQNHDGSVLDHGVVEFMASNPRVLRPEQLLGEALRLFKDARVDQMPVVDSGGRPVGLLDVQDLLEVRL